jgi:Thioredoxin-like [2Fe-2S] ferredoxin
MNRTTTILFVLLLLQIATCTAITPSPLSKPTAQATTDRTIIRVCSGADCRVDGSAQCLRLLHDELRSRRNTATVAAAVIIKSVPCIGPCGDGPNVVVVDEADGKRIVDRALAQRKERPLSLAPADMFGANTAGVYQVRNAEMADAVMNLALSGTTSSNTGGTGSTASG